LDANSGPMRRFSIREVGGLHRYHGRPGSWRDASFLAAGLCFQPSKIELNRYAYFFADLS
jgi:hypothetical protein